MTSCYSLERVRDVPALCCSRSSDSKTIIPVIASTIIITSLGGPANGGHGTLANRARHPWRGAKRTFLEAEGFVSIILLDARLSELWTKYESGELERILDEKEDSYSRIDWATMMSTSFWALAGSLPIGVGLGISTNLGTIFGLSSILNQICLVAVLFILFMAVLIAVILFERLVFERSDKATRRKFIYERQIKNGRKLCQACQTLLSPETVNCDACGRSLVSTADFHWVEERSGK